MKKVILAALALVPALAFANPGAYVQGQAGLGFVDSNTVSLANGFIGGVGAGYLWGDNAVNYGVETDAQYYPNSERTTAGVEREYKGYNLSLLAIVKYTSCSTGFDVFAKGGGAFLHQTLTIEPNSASDNSWAPEAAVGVGYVFNPHWEMDLTADEIFANLGPHASTVNNNQFKAAQNGSVMLGVAYHFA